MSHRPRSECNTQQRVVSAFTDQKRSEKTSVETSVQTREKTPARILRLLGKQPELTLEVVATELGKSVRAVELAVSKLVKEGKLRRVGSKKSGHWEIKQ